MGDFFGVGSAVGGGLQAASSVYAAQQNYRAVQETNEANKEINEATNDANRKLAEAQNDWNFQQWQRENDYNAPVAQAQRLKQAGLSSAAAASAVSGGEAAPLQSADLANQQVGTPMQAPQLDLSGLNLVGLARSVMALQKDRVQLAKAQNELEAQPQMILNEMEAQQWANKTSAMDYEHAIEEWPYKLESAKADLIYKRLDSSRLRIANKQAKLNIKLTNQKFGFLEKFNDVELKKMSADLENIFKQGELYQAQIRNVNKDTQLKGAQIVETQAATENVKEQKKGISQENVIKEMDATLKRFGAPEVASQRLAALFASGKLQNGEIDKFLKCLHVYLASQRHEFIGDARFRSYLLYILDEGQSHARSLGVHTVGAARDAADDLLDVVAPSVLK